MNISGCCMLSTRAGLRGEGRRRGDREKLEECVYVCVCVCVCVSVCDPGYSVYGHRVSGYMVSGYKMRGEGTQNVYFIARIYTFSMISEKTHKKSCFKWSWAPPPYSPLKKKKSSCGKYRI